MIFKIRNLGIVESADIEVNGLTVITGLNDTGKSFISKSIFAIIHTINNVEEEEKEKNTKTVNRLWQIYGWCKEIIEITGEMENRLYPGLTISEIEIIIKHNEAQYSNPRVNKKISNYKTLIFDYINASDAKMISSEQRKLDCIKNINDSFDFLMNIFTRANKKSANTRKSDKESGGNKRIDTRFFRSFNEKIRYYFGKQICSLNGKGNLSIEVCETEDSPKNIVEIKASNEQLTKIFKYTPPIIYKDATLIETPIIIQLSRYLNFTLTADNKNEIPMHLTDLADKLIKSTTRYSDGEFSELYEKICEIIGGRVEVDPDDANIAFWKYKFLDENESHSDYKEIVLQKIRGQGDSRISSFNIATGIKSLGILQLLFNGNYINSKSILIIDEPEVHLHPQWIVEYAKIISALCKANIKVIISTHSDLLISALNNCVKKYELETTSRFYFGEKIGKTVKYKDITKDLDPIYKELVIAEMKTQTI